MLHPHCSLPLSPGQSDLDTAKMVVTRYGLRYRIALHMNSPNIVRATDDMGVASERSFLNLTCSGCQGGLHAAGLISTGLACLVGSASLHDGCTFQTSS